MGRSLGNAPLVEDLVAILLIILGMLWQPQLIPVLAASVVGLMVLRRAVWMAIHLVQHVWAHSSSEHCIAPVLVQVQPARLLAVFVQSDRCTPTVPHR